MLFSPIKIGTLNISNRFVRAATYEKQADIDGFVTDALVQTYTKLAKGAAGLIITGIALVNVSGALHPNMLAIHSDRYIAGLKRLTASVHESSDAKIFIQLFHAGGLANPALTGMMPLGPSGLMQQRSPVRELTHSEICRLVEDFGFSAFRAMSAGFDGIELHAGHGYLIHQFLSPLTNRRDDYWGGDENRRFHFLEETYSLIRQEVGYDYPVIIKLNVCDCKEGGLQRQEAINIAKRCEDLGFDAIELSGGMRDGTKTPAVKDILSPQQEAYWQDDAVYFREMLKVPLILCGGIRSLAVAEKIINSGIADMVSMARPFIRESDIVNKFALGKAKSDCISCNLCMQYDKLDVVKCCKINEAVKTI